MFNVKTKRKLGEYTIYRVPYTSRIVESAVGIGGLLVLGVLLTVAELGVFSLIIVWVALYIANSIYHLFVDWLITSSEGVEFYIHGTHGFTEWDNIAKFGVHGIHLRQPITVIKDLPSRILRWPTHDALIPIHMIVAATLWGTIHVTKNTRTHFGRDLYHYAPHLYGDVLEKQS